MRPSLLPRRESAGPHRLHNSSPALAGLRSARAHTSHRYIIETSRVGKLRRRSARVGLSAVIISLLPLAPPPSAPLLVRRDNVGHTSSLIPPSCLPFAREFFTFTRFLREETRDDKFGEIYSARGNRRRSALKLRETEAVSSGCCSVFFYTACSENDDS